MKVFISWSGDVSHSVAEALREWLPNVIQAVDPWMSAEDIDKGARWSADIAGELANTKVGVVCVTTDNMYAPWLNFEAGALSKSIEKTFVCPYLLGLSVNELQGPLVQFQATVAEKDDTRRLVTTINAALDKEALPEKQLDKIFQIWWPELEQMLERIRATKTSPKPRRSEREILEEILGLVRERARQEPWKPILQAAQYLQDTPFLHNVYAGGRLPGRVFWKNVKGQMVPAADVLYFLNEPAGEESPTTSRPKAKEVKTENQAGEEAPTGGAEAEVPPTKKHDA